MNEEIGGGITPEKKRENYEKNTNEIAEEKGISWEDIVRNDAGVEKGRFLPHLYHGLVS